MKFIAKLILTIFFILVFLIFIFAVNLRFQLLVPSFWENTFGTNSTYSKLSISINKNLESQVVAEGGKASDVKILTDLITPVNLKDTIDRNINNVLQYANGEVDEIIIYVPVDKIPRSLLSQNFNAVREQMSLPDLIKEFNITGVSPVQIQMISHVGEAAWLLLFFATLLLVLIFCLLYLCVGPCKRLTAPAIALILSGLIGLAITFLVTLIQNNWAEGAAGGSSTVDSLVGIIVPPVIGGVLKVWVPFTVGALILGIVLLFLKKSYNSKKK